MLHFMSEKKETKIQTLAKWNLQLLTSAHIEAAIPPLACGRRQTLLYLLVWPAAAAAISPTVSQ